MFECKKIGRKTNENEAEVGKKKTENIWKREGKNKKGLRRWRIAKRRSRIKAEIKKRTSR